MVKVSRNCNVVSHNSMGKPLVRTSKTRKALSVTGVEFSPDGLMRKTPEEDFMSKAYQSLSHSKWNCKSHVLIPSNGSIRITINVDKRATAFEATQLIKPPPLAGLSDLIEALSKRPSIYHFIINTTDYCILEHRILKCLYEE